MLTGLFLGAGASYEVGMPLVWELTTELKAWLTPERLRDLNKEWRNQGGGYDDDVIEALGQVLMRADVHYEGILGFLETEYRRQTAKTQQFHELYARLVEIVYWILYLRHINNVAYIQRTLPYLEGIARLAEKNSPLWIFSLNHDLIVECIAAQYHIPIVSGLGESTETFPRRSADGAKIGELRVEAMTGEKFEKGGPPFLQPGKRGINLLKIHGALDIFTFRDGKDLLKLLPREETVAGVIESLRIANEELIYIDAACPEHPVKATNEIAFADETGEMQFLRRSLLAGAFKFDRRFGQVLPACLLDHFRSHLNYVGKLVCIGYGFGDVHVNQTLREWLEFSAERHLEIVAPGVKQIPSSLLHLAPQVTLTDAAATDYLDAAAGIVRTRREVLEKRFIGWARQRGGGLESAKKELQTFLEQFRETRMANFVEKLKGVPFRDGDVDLEALGMTHDEFVEKWKGELASSYEDLLEAFLKSREAGR
jgi:hypothetical protein